jgi:hypothetical protein
MTSRSVVRAFHLISADSQGRLTKIAGHYVIRIGQKPTMASVER